MASSVIKMNSSEPIRATANTAYVDSNSLYVTRVGRLVNVSGRFHVKAEKPAGQANYLFTGLPTIAGGAIVSFYDATGKNLIITGNLLTSNDAIPVGYYNVQFTYPCQ